MNPRYREIDLPNDPIDRIMAVHALEGRKVQILDRSSPYWIAGRLHVPEGSTAAYCLKGNHGDDESYRYDDLRRIMVRVEFSHLNGSRNGSSNSS